MITHQSLQKVKVKRMPILVLVLPSLNSFSNEKCNEIESTQNMALFTQYSFSIISESLCASSFSSNPNTTASVPSLFLSSITSSSEL